ILEINANPQRLDLSSDAIANQNVMFTANTDAHHTDHLDFMHYGVSTLQKGFVKTSQVLNTLSREEFKAYINKDSRVILMNDKTFTTLEFDKILNSVKTFAISDKTKEQLNFSIVETDYDTVVNIIEEVDNASTMLRYRHVELGGISDIKPFVK